MGYIVILMLLAFFFGGLGLLKLGVGMIGERFNARARWLSLPGTILRVERVYRHSGSPGLSRRRRDMNYRNMPWIRFTDPHGKQVDFRSELGDIGTPSRYKAGQPIEVLYDPEGRVSPLIDDGWAIWFGPVSITFASLLFITCAVSCSYLFRDQILRTTFLGALVEMIAER